MVKHVEGRRVRNYVAGSWVDSDLTIPMRDPYRGEYLGEICVADSATVDRAVRSAVEGAEVMARMPAYQRAALLRKVPNLLQRHYDQLAEVMARQTGKALKDCRAEVDRSISTMELCAEEARRITGEVIPVDAVPGGVGKLGFAMRFPVGVVAAITPFNAPLNLACHKIGPALAAGNAVVVKPSPEGAWVTQLLVEIFLEAGAPPTALQLINGEAETGEALVKHPRVDLINFTGGGVAAQNILKVAGLKRTFFELGGNGATIVHHDANLAKAAAEITGGAFGLTGQSCASVQRVYVHNAVLDEFVHLLVERTKALKVGDPLDLETDVGTLVSEAAAERVESWVQEAVGRGAQLLTGGTRRGAQLWPTILLNPPASCKVVCEEVFGPTLAVIGYDDLSDAIDWVNDSPWGLQAGIYTASLDVAMAALRRIRVGGLNVNGPSRGRTDVQPYGGVKQSGWGREGPRYAILEMTEVRMITFAPHDTVLR